MFLAGEGAALPFGETVRGKAAARSKRTTVTAVLDVAFRSHVLFIILGLVLLACLACIGIDGNGDSLYPAFLNSCICLVSSARKYQESGFHLGDTIFCEVEGSTSVAGRRETYPLKGGRIFTSLLNCS